MKETWDDLYGEIATTYFRADADSLKVVNLYAAVLCPLLRPHEPRTPPLSR